MLMSPEEESFVAFLKNLMRVRKRLPSQLAADLGVSHSTVIRWLSGKDIPNIKSCRNLAEYSGISVTHILSVAGYMPAISEVEPAYLPEFREYAQQKYPGELDEDLIAVIEDLIERRRARKRGRDRRLVLQE